MGAKADADRLLTREFVTLGLASMLVFGATGAVNPVLPRFLRDELGASNTAVGLVIGSLAISAVLTRPFLGRLGDRHGLRLLLELGGLLVGLGLVLNTVVDSVALAVPARLLVGAGQAALMTGAMTLAVNIAPPHRQGEATAYVLVSFHFGLAFAPLLGELLLDAYSFEAVWIATGALALAGSLVASFIPSRPRVEGESRDRHLFHRRSILPGVTMGIGVVAFSGFQAFLVLFAHDIGIQRVAPLFLLSSATIIVVRVFGGRLPDRLGPIRGGTLSLGLVVIGLLVVSVWQVPIGLCAAVVVIGCGSALLFPSLAPAAINGVPESSRTSALATFTLFIDLGSALGAPLYGLVSSVTSYGTAYAVAAGIAFGALLCLRLVLAPRLGPSSPMIETQLAIDVP